MPVDHLCLVALELAGGEREHRQVAVDRHTGEALDGLGLEVGGLAVAVARLPVVGAAPAEAHVADRERVRVVVDVEEVARRLIGAGLHTVAVDRVALLAARFDLKAEVRVVRADEVGLVRAALAPHTGVGHLQPEHELPLERRADERAADERRHRAVIVERRGVEEGIAALPDGPQSALADPVQLKVERMRDDRGHVTHTRLRI
ncbi:MAG: hypothetical protein CMP58_03425 [Flavobacteriales bacterium]|nr:hypothetical protein [Flavobacteriales bacterium]